MGKVMLVSNLCAYCNKSFDRKTHNQKYCDEECCRKATNERIMQRYYEKRDNRRGKERVCSHHDCVSKLSRYNEEDVCALHARKRNPEREKLMKLFNK
jgi:hypothetical protein